jgi:hypothetical protein
MAQREAGLKSSSLAFVTYLAQTAIVFGAYFVAGRLGQATTNIRSGNLGPCGRHSVSQSQQFCSGAVEFGRRSLQPPSLWHG